MKLSYVVILSLNNYNEVELKDIENLAYKKSCKIMSDVLERYTALRLHYIKIQN